MVNTLEDASLATGTVVDENHGARRVADATICLVRTQRARNVLASTYRREAMSTALDALIAGANGVVVTHPRLVGTIRS